MHDKSFDIVLCDYNLGEGKDGQQVLEEAKEDSLLPYSSIFIMTTAENSMEMVMGAAEYQPDDYLSKPFTKQVLQTRLKRLLAALSLCEKQLALQPGNRFELLKLKGELSIKAVTAKPCIIANATKKPRPPSRNSSRPVPTTSSPMTGWRGSTKNSMNRKRPRRSSPKPRKNRPRRYCVSAHWLRYHSRTKTWTPPKRLTAA